MAWNGLKLHATRKLIGAMRFAEKRLPWRVVKNRYLVQTIGDQLFWAARSFIPLGSVEALDIFSGTGLMMSYAYLHHCTRADLWEINPTYADHLKFLGPHVTGHCGDSITAINQGDPRLKKYNFILADNPLGLVRMEGKHGCEHFEIIPAVFRYFKREPGVLVINYIPDARALYQDPRFAHHVTDEDKRLHDERRRAFFETDEPIIRPQMAVAKYRREAAGEQFEVTDFNILPRAGTFSFLQLFIKPV